MGKGNELDIIMQDPRFVELALKVMEADSDIDEDYLIPFTEDDVDEDGNKMVQTRTGDYGKDINYVPVKYVRQRMDKAFNGKWSFFIVAERRETEPFDRWSKNDDDYVEGSKYLKCIGMMIIPGLGIRMEYGVKKVFGDAESTDWKACKTDAFKKCCEAFGIYMDYEMGDSDEDDSSNRNSRNGKNKKGKKIDTSDVEYSDDELEEALETEVTFGKYDGSTLQEIAEDDIDYVKWLAENARDDEMQDNSLIVLAYYNEQEEEKSSRRSKGRTSSNSSKKSKSSSRRNRNDDEDEKPRHNRNSNKKKSKSSEDEDDERRDEIISACEEEFENYDRVQMKALISSVSTSNKHPNGKTKLNDLTMSELEELLEVLDIEV